MANWFYYDMQNSKIGPVTSAQLKALAKKGVINPDTVIETDTGRRGTAEKIHGLVFLSPLPETILIMDSPSSLKESFAQRPSGYMQKIVAVAITGFAAGLIVMFVFDYIYCSRESYKKRVAQSFLENAIKDAPLLLKYAIRGAFYDELSPPAKTPKKLDPRMKQFEVKSWKPYFKETMYSNKLYVAATVKNGTGKAVKSFAFLVTAKKKGRTVPIFSKERVYFLPKTGIEPNETIVETGFGDDIYGIVGENLDTIEFTMSLDEITFFDDECIENVL